MTKEKVYKKRDIIYPIKPQNTGQKVNIEQGFRYRIDGQGNVLKTPDFSKMTEQEKKLVLEYYAKKHKKRQDRIQKIREISKKRGVNSAKKLKKKKKN